MKRFYIILFLSFQGIFVFAQIDYSTFHSDIIEFQENLNHEFSDSTTSPLSKIELANFKSLDFFPLNDDFIVKAYFIRTTNQKSFEMKTTTSRKPIYRKYGEVFFFLDGRAFSLIIYQNLGFLDNEEYKDYLFLPFTDATNGEESYGGGRYIDLKLPLEQTFYLNFNMAYNPSCAYNHKYSCPIPPSENDLDVKILAGVKAYH